MGEELCVDHEKSLRWHQGSIQVISDDLVKEGWAESIFLLRGNSDSKRKMKDGKIPRIVMLRTDLMVSKLGESALGQGIYTVGACNLDNQPTW